MLLRKLEAYGFKSFADKTEVEFGNGITAIVGPNGSGKSNISDAIRWVLGEQSVRTLRGTKMEDIIFAGSAGRRPLGIAEVSLVFDNTSGVLPIDYNEVTITRRVFRSGESEYYLNKTQCRLKDIYELLADTGLGRDAMTVIGQNKVDEVLNNKPEERRLLFEEAAGISKYKQRKKEALRKLEDTKQNLTRVLDIANEIEGQLEPLAASAERTKAYNQLRDTLKHCQITVIMDKFAKAQKMVESALLQQAQLNDDELACSTQLTLMETEKERVTTALADCDAQLGTLLDHTQQVDTAIERAQGRRAVLEERLAQSAKAQERNQADKSVLEQQNQELNNKLAQQATRLAESQQEQETVAQLLQTKENELAKLQASLLHLEQQIEQDKEKSFDYLQESVNARNRLSTLERDTQKLHQDLLHTTNDRQQYSQEIADNQKEQELLANEYNKLKQELVDLASAQQQQQQRISEQETQKHELDKEAQRIINRTNELKSRLHVLTSMQDALEGFARGSKSILQSKASWRNGVCGAVAQILQVPDSYVTAVEIALGGALQHIITDDDQTAKQAMQYLKQNNHGRATFLPLTTIRPFAPRENERKAAAMEGAIGLGADLVNCDAKFRKVVEFLLGRTVIARDIDAALAIARALQYSVKIVTLDGEILNPGGSMTGGSTHKREASFLSRNNEVQHIQEELTICKETWQTVDNRRQQLLGEMQELQNIQKDLQTRQQSVTVKLAETNIQQENLTQDAKRLQFALQTLEQELQQHQAELQKWQETRTLLLGQMEELALRDAEHKETLQNWQQTAKEYQEKRSVLQEQVTSQKLQLTAIEERHQHYRLQMNEYQAGQSDISERYQALCREEQSLIQQTAKSKQELTHIGAETARLLAEKQQCSEQYNTLYINKTELLTTLNTTEKTVRELRRKQQEYQNRLHEVNLLATKYGLEVEHCQTQLTEQFAITMDEATAFCLPDPLDMVQKQLTATESAIARLGPVNPAAIEEYERLQERFTFMQQQIGDLTEAKEYLVSIIENMDATMAEQFSHAFNAINQHFSDIFTKLFGGGKAYLNLLDPAQILDSGIDIHVQPPGKKMQNLVLLSGGERALTVIALLFALLTYRPAPFVVVDEIDAALDEANVDRFSEFLRDYAQQTQFIVVTHRKGTMEAANIIHGITMEDSGVSRLVSVKLMDKAG